MSESLHDPVEIALQEDIGEGDITTEFFVAADSQAKARIVAREKAVVAGTHTTTEVFHRIDGATKVHVICEDGSKVKPGDTIIEIEGLTWSILKAERVALNFLQRLCGIATLTRQFVEAVGKHPAKILDTRKTTPGLRVLEKAAVVVGGGQNHRFGLYDMVLLKDNHLRATSGTKAVAETIRRVREIRPDVRIEVEADSLEQVRAFLKMDDVDLILLDNMKPAQIRQAVALGKRKVKFEASGGVTLKNVGQIAATGVDFISVGALTHSARAIDLSLELTHVGA
jgi:nicotinate-nucleotide pyrophosphorylase (carboxylating)